MVRNASVYDAEFYERIRTGARRSARRIVPLVLELTTARSVIDVGCGSGVWVSVFDEHGVDDTLGVEASHIDPDALDVAADRILHHDLRQPLRLDRRFDLALSLEVAEHLPEASARPFVASLAALAPLVLFSAAAPHQGGTEHVNEQWPDYWAERFDEHGFVPVDCIRRRVWSDPEVEWWYAQNTLLFVDSGELDRRPRLRQEYEFAGTNQLSIVHPRRHLEWVEWGLAESRARWAEAGAAPLSS